MDDITDQKLAFDGPKNLKRPSQSIEYIEQEINNIIDNSDVSNFQELRNKFARFINMQYLNGFK